MSKSKPKGFGVEKKKSGRHLTYTDKLGEEICLKLAVSSKGIQRLCDENPHWPCFQTIYEWRIKVPSFGDMYARAKQQQVEVLVDECLLIADDTTQDTIVKTSKKGDEFEACNSEWVNRSRLRIDTRKWLAAKLAPKIYGDKPKDEETATDFLSTIKDLVSEKR